MFERFAGRPYRFGCRTTDTPEAREYAQQRVRELSQAQRASAVAWRRHYRAIATPTGRRAPLVRLPDPAEPPPPPPPPPRWPCADNVGLNA